MGDVYRAQGDLVVARKAYEESLALRKQTGEKQTVGETDLALARLAVEESHAADAESVIRHCKEQFHQDRESDDELAASITLVNALLAESRYPEAGKEVGESESLAAKSVNELLRLQFDLASARVEGASGALDLSISKLEKTLAGAYAHNLLEALSGCEGKDRVDTAC
jgi:hypothetical protein